MRWRATRVLVFAGASACGGIGTGGLLQPPASDPAASATEYGATGAGGAAGPDADATATSGPSVAATSDAATDAMVPAAIDAPFEAALDGGGHNDAPATDAGADDPVETDGATSCVELSQCCERLIVAPPLAAACYLSTQTSDSGSAGTCISTLAGLRDSGLCP